RSVEAGRYCDRRPSRLRRAPGLGRDGRRCGRGRRARGHGEDEREHLCEILEGQMTLAAQRRWIMPKKAGDVPDGIPALVAQVLGCRGLAVGDMAAFLAARPTEEGPPMLDLDRAVERLRRAPAARARLAIYGVY